MTVASLVMSDEPLLGLLPLQGEYTNCFVHRVLPYAMCFWALAFPSAADLFDVQPACHVIADNHKYNMSKKVIKDVGFCIVEKCHKLPKETEKL